MGLLRTRNRTNNSRIYLNLILALVFEVRCRKFAIWDLAIWNLVLDNLVL